MDYLPADYMPTCWHIVRCRHIVRLPNITAVLCYKKNNSNQLVHSSGLPIYALMKTLIMQPHAPLSAHFNDSVKC